jgi:sugar lactone lactonase YvrE
MTDRLQVLVDDLVFPEGPRWRDGRPWFSDMLAGRVMNVDLEGRSETVVQAEGWLSGLGWLPDGAGTRALPISQASPVPARMTSGWPGV